MNEDLKLPGLASIPLGELFAEIERRVPAFVAVVVPPEDSEADSAVAVDYYCGGRWSEQVGLVQMLGDRFEGLRRHTVYLESEG